MTWEPLCSWHQTIFIVRHSTDGSVLKSSERSKKPCHLVIICMVLSALASMLYSANKEPQPSSPLKRCLSSGYIIHISQQGFNRLKDLSILGFEQQTEIRQYNHRKASFSEIKFPLVKFKLWLLLYHQTFRLQLWRRLNSCLLLLCWWNGGSGPGDEHVWYKQTNRVKSLKPRADPDINPDPDPDPNLVYCRYMVALHRCLFTIGCAMHVIIKAYY